MSREAPLTNEAWRAKYAEKHRIGGPRPRPEMERRKREDRMNDAAKRLLRDLGATNAVDPTALTGRVAKRFSMLARHFLYLTDHAERRDASGENSDITRGNML